jgi:hypothetical protein
MIQSALILQLMDLVVMQMEFLIVDIVDLMILSLVIIPTTIHIKVN